MSEVTDKNDQLVSKEDNFVPKDAYKRVSEDMHKYKNQMKEYQAQVEQFKLEKDEMQKQTLIEQEKWQELYKRSEEKMKFLEAERDNERNKFINSHKLNAVIQQVGGLKRPEYVKFIDVKDVQIKDDGSIDNDSLLSLSERIKREYPELLASSMKTSLPDKAPSSPSPKTISEMNENERDALRRSLLNKK